MRRISEQEKQEIEILYRNNISARCIAAHYGFGWSSICRLMIRLGVKPKTIEEILQDDDSKGK